MRFTRRAFAVVLLGGLVATSCGSDDDGGGDAIEEIGEGEGEVSIIAWAGYIERGDTDPAFDWVTEFEADTGCKVSVKTAATSDEMVSLMTGSDGEYDLVTASGDASLRLIRGGTVQPVNIDLIPSYDTVDDRLKEAPWHYVDGEHYGTPYLWGSNVLMYNTEVFPEAPTSWNVVFEEQELPDGESNAGRVQAYDGPIHLADAAQYLKVHKPELPSVHTQAWVSPFWQAGTGRHSQSLQTSPIQTCDPAEPSAQVQARVVPSRQATSSVPDPHPPAASPITIKHADKNIIVFMAFLLPSLPLPGHRPRRARIHQN